MRLTLQQKIDKLKKLAKAYEGFKDNNLKEAIQAQKEGDKRMSAFYNNICAGYIEEINTIKQIIRFLENDEKEIAFINSMINE